MNRKKRLFGWVVLVLALTSLGLVVGLAGCSIGAETGENQDPAISTESRGEHNRDVGGGGEGEELGTELALTDRYDGVRYGARLILAYDAQSNSFVGSVENTTNNALARVRVKVHLSNGKELGPTTPIDLAPGESVPITLPATDQAFDGWTTHAEVGGGGAETGGEHGSSGEGGEHGSGGEGDGEHGSGSEGGGEHGGGNGG